MRCRVRTDTTRCGHGDDILWARVIGFRDITIAYVGERAVLFLLYGRGWRQGGLRLGDSLLGWLRVQRRSDLRSERAGGRCRMKWEASCVYLHTVCIKVDHSATRRCYLPMPVSWCSVSCMQVRGHTASETSDRSTKHAGYECHDQRAGCRQI